MRHHTEPPASGTGREALPLALGLMLAAGLAAVATRLLTAAGLWPWNLTPLGALGLYGGARLRSWRALVVPAAVMVTTDLILWAALGWAPFNPFVYAAFAVYVLLGCLLARTESPVRIGAACVVGSVQFFLLTNFSVWLALSRPAADMPAGQAVVWEDQGGSYPTPTYARNLPGLLTCYAVALPFTNRDAPPLGFFGNWLLGDFLFAGLLFGAHAWLSRRSFLAGFPATARAG